ncbi:diaminopimelate epimerase [Saccharopolyspora endophytica]|uniref:Diaminopimelate epimerase n=1 Tax=Saccharopolyspora endophytica TaxID=543886 RepID=A0ABS5DAA3_9PSEU|nr:diaminopimelate epimerase [Saccharopolyspora endophytica]MBQ0923225.1 diaminopimelate epimerase [Saccharopolyspora endophytica]
MHPFGGPEYIKGHGTQNDFVILPDPDGELELTGDRVRALCDRQRGLGADGVLRVIRAGNLPDAPADVPSDVWFMDYRNADGSIAEMCGNGVRVFARYLVASGLAPSGDLLVGTRAGIRPVHTHQDGRVTVEMGQAKIFGESTTTVNGTAVAGVAVDVGNPHLACVGAHDLDALDLTAAPPHDVNLFPDGVNVEFVRPRGGDEVRIRVHERGVGETRSCGTGTVAATAAALHAAGQTTGRRLVHIPGGTVEVEITASGSTLTGPAVLVGGGRLDPDWWQNP